MLGFKSPIYQTFDIFSRKFVFLFPFVIYFKALVGILNVLYYNLEKVVQVDITTVDKF